MTNHFFALELPAEARAYAARIRDQWRARIGESLPLPPTNPRGNTELYADDLASYINRLTRTKLLTATEEKSLAQRVRNGDHSAKARLIEANMRLVVSIAKNYMASGIPLEDLIQEGSIGLMTATERFDPQMGYRFSTYATQWIRQSIGHAIDNKAKAIPLPATNAERDQRRGVLVPGTQANWNEPGDFHITLCFPGAIAESERSRWIEAAAPIAAQTRPVPITLAAPDTFHEGSVLFVGVEKTPELVALAERLETTMAALGYAPDARPYTPHVTLARSVHPLASSLDKYERAFPEWTAARFVLMQTLPPESRPNPGDLRYTIVHSFPFGRTAP